MSLFVCVEVLWPGQPNGVKHHVITRAVVGQRSSPAGYIPTNDILIDDGYLRI